MIIDLTQTKMERDICIANLQEQLRQTHNNPNIKFGCSCGKNICYGHAPKLRGTDPDRNINVGTVPDPETLKIIHQYIYPCRHGSLDGLIH